MKDYQRAKVYAWEDKCVAPWCPGIVSFNAGQLYVDGVWLASQWQRPPRVVSLSKRKYTVKAMATYGEVHLPERIPGWIILHELAHSLTDDKHGPNFVGMYIDLLERVEKLSRVMTMYTLKQAGIDFNLGVKPLDWVIRR